MRLVNSIGKYYTARAQNCSSGPPSFLPAPGLALIHQEGFPSLLNDDVLIVAVVVLVAGMLSLTFLQDLGIALIALAVVALIASIVLPTVTRTSAPSFGSTAPMDSSKSCVNCGQPLRPSDVFCPYCGRETAS